MNSRVGSLAKISENFVNSIATTLIQGKGEVQEERVSIKERAWSQGDTFTKIWYLRKSE